MITKADLERVRYSESRLKYLDKKIKTLRENMTSTASKMDGMPHGGSLKDVMAEFVAKVDELEREYVRRVLELENLKLRVDAAIDELPPKEGEIVRMRELQGMTWSQVAKASNYSEKQAMRIHRKSLKNMSDNVR